MFKIVNAAVRSRFTVCFHPKRTFLSQAYHCNEIWDDRLNSPLFQKVNLDLLYHELDQGFQKTRRISAVDVDIFANAVKDNLFVDELLDLVHKLRLSPDTGNALSSTSHAVIRALVSHDKDKELLDVVDDRLNYGVFLDDYTGNLLMDRFWKSKDFAAGAKIASQFMLQEDFKHPVTINFALLHCYNYLVAPGEWVQAPVPEEPEDEVKVRVKYLRNPFDDEHFDLKDPVKIVGKTLAVAAKNRDDCVHKSLRVVGLALFGREELARKEVAKNNVKLVKEVVDLLPQDVALKQELAQLDLISEDVHVVLQKQVAESVSQISEKDIANQCDVFKQWEDDRLRALEEQKQRLLTAERLAEVENLQKSLQEKEQKLWFFENEENIELAIEESSAALRHKPTKKKKIEEDYVPPEVTAKRN